MTQLPAAWLHRPQGPSWLQVQVEDAQVEDARLPDPVPTFASLRRVTQPGASPAPTAAEAEVSVVSNEPQLENSSAPGAPGQRGAWARHRVAPEATCYTCSNCGRGQAHGAGRATCPRQAQLNSAELSRCQGAPDRGEGQDHAGEYGRNRSPSF